MAVRLSDVAERAGVSVKTASNVINNYPHIKPATRKRVEAAIHELRYRPNVSARQLKHGRAGFLALAVPQMDVARTSPSSRPRSAPRPPGWATSCCSTRPAATRRPSDWCWTACGRTSSTD